MSNLPADQTQTAGWLRELAVGVNSSRFRQFWLHPMTEEAEQGYLAACYERIAEHANSEGEYYLAYDAANHGLRCAAAAGFPPHVLTSRKVTALARSGATREAQRVLEEFLGIHQADSSICSAKARLLRDLGLAAATADERGKLLSEAASWAEQAKGYAHQEGKDWAYPANQEVQFRFLAGQHDVARACASAVIDFVQNRPDADSFWNQVNLAEMHLVRGDLAAAEKHYQKASELGMASQGDVMANRAVAEILLRELPRPSGTPGELLDRWFPKPVIIVFAGHIPDARHRPKPRLPEALCRRDGPLAAALAERIRGFKAVEGICASAPGGDILFAEALMAAGACLGLIDPFPRRRIEEVARNVGGDWPERLAKVFREATRSEAIACAEDADEGAQCEYATQVMIGAAMLRTGRINAKLQALVVWDGADAESPTRGGTGQFVMLCRQAGIPVEIINPAKLSV